MNKLIFLSTLVFVLFSCGKSKPSRTTAAIDAPEMKEIVLSKDSIIYIQDWVKDVEVIPLGSSGHTLVGSIDDIIVTDDHIIIYSSRQSCVFIFGRDGKHRATINRRGRGPQEYMSITHIAMPPDNKRIAIHDNRGGKVLYFSLDGRFISATPTGFWFSGMEYLDDDNLVCVAYGLGGSDPGLAGYDNRNDLVYFTDKKFGIKSSTLPAYTQKQPTTPNFRKFGERVYVNRCYSDTIYQATQDGLKAAYRIDMEKIGGVANLDPDITGEDLGLLLEKKTIFSGRFTGIDDYLWISVGGPKNKIADYLYSKRSGKVYSSEKNYDTTDILLWFLVSSPQTSIKDRFVAAVSADHVVAVGPIDSKTGIQTSSAVTQRPELANLTEYSNPVIILYSLKEGL